VICLSHRRVPMVRGFPGSPTIEDGEANGIIYGTLGVVLVLTLLFAFSSKQRQMLTNMASSDVYMAARNSQGTISLTLSYFVSGVGAWVIFATPQAAVVGGSVALAGYTLSTVFPLLLFGLIAPTMRDNLPKGFTLNEYVYGRFGGVCAAYFGLVSLFYMMLYLTAELASAGTLASTLTRIEVQDKTWWQNDNTFLPMPISPIIGTSLTTLLYTVLGGLPVSLLTDRVQGTGIFILTLVICIAAYAEAGINDRSAWEEVTGHGVSQFYLPTDYGNSVAIAISLIMGVTCANMVHAGYWQRIWAAETNAAVQRATVLAGILSAIVMVLVGITGYIAYSQFSILIVPGGGTAGDLSFLSVPWLIVTFMDQWWAVITLIFGISMIASTCDTLQSGMTALLWPLANSLMPNASDKCKLALIIVVMVLLNVPPILLALSGQSILQLFLLADLLAAGVVSPLFLGFWKRTHPMGALAGAVGGLATTLVVYAVGEQYGEGFDTLIAQGGIFRRVATYAFVLTPTVSAIITVVVSLLIPGYEFAGYPKTEEQKGDVQMTNTADTEVGYA